MVKVRRAKRPATADRKIHGELNTVKPVLRGHLWDKQKVVFQDR